MNEIKRLGAEPHNIGVGVVSCGWLPVITCARDHQQLYPITQERINWEYKICGALKQAAGDAAAVQEHDDGVVDVDDEDVHVSDAEVDEVGRVLVLYIHGQYACNTYTMMQPLDKYLLTTTTIHHITIPPTHFTGQALHMNRQEAQQRHAQFTNGGVIAQHPSSVSAAAAPTVPYSKLAHSIHQHTAPQHSTACMHTPADQKAGSRLSVPAPTTRPPLDAPQTSVGINDAGGAGVVVGEDDAIGAAVHGQKQGVQQLQKQGAQLEGVQLQKQGAQPQVTAGAHDVPQAVLPAVALPPSSSQQPPSQQPSSQQPPSQGPPAAADTHDAPIEKGGDMCLQGGEEVNKGEELYDGEEVYEGTLMPSFAGDLVTVSPHSMVCLCLYVLVCAYMCLYVLVCAACACALHSAKHPPIDQQKHDTTPTYNTFMYCTHPSQRTHSMHVTSGAPPLHMHISQLLSPNQSVRQAPMHVPAPPVHTGPCAAPPAAHGALAAHEPPAPIGVARMTLTGRTPPSQGNVLLPHAAVPVPAAAHDNAPLPDSMDIDQIVDKNVDRDAVAAQPNAPPAASSPMYHQNVLQLEQQQHGGHVQQQQYVEQHPHIEQHQLSDMQPCNTTQPTPLSPAPSDNVLAHSQQQQFPSQQQQSPIPSDNLLADSQQQSLGGAVYADDDRAMVDDASTKPPLVHPQPAAIVHPPPVPSAIVHPPVPPQPPVLGHHAPQPPQPPPAAAQPTSPPLQPRSQQHVLVGSVHDAAYPTLSHVTSTPCDEEAPYVQQQGAVHNALHHALHRGGGGAPDSMQVLGGGGTHVAAHVAHAAHAAQQQRVPDMVPATQDNDGIAIDATNNDNEIHNNENNDKNAAGVLAQHRARPVPLAAVTATQQAEPTSPPPIKKRHTAAAAATATVAAAAVALRRRTRLGSKGSRRHVVPRGSTVSAANQRALSLRMTMKARLAGCVVGCGFCVCVCVLVCIWVCVQECLSV